MSQITYGPNALWRALHIVAKLALLPALLFILTNQFAHAGSATWKLNPVNDVWNNVANWTPATVPNGSDDVATFKVSNQTEVDLSGISGGLSEVNSIVFGPGASAYNLSFGSGQHGDSVTVSGSGIINNSRKVQTISIDYNDYPDSYTNDFKFTQSADAGDLIQFNLIGQDYDGELYGGWLIFEDASTAGSALINNYGLRSEWGGTHFYDGSSAGEAGIHNVELGYDGGFTWFSNNATAGNATIVIDGAGVSSGSGGEVLFDDSSSAGNSTITCQASTVADPIYPAEVEFFYGSDGGSARFILLGDGEIRTDRHYAGTVPIGSLEGDGYVIIAYDEAMVLSIGSNNLSTTFSGVLKAFDSAHERNASVKKVGTGRLVLTRANTYAGGTTVEAGILLVNNTSGSGTGSGNVFVTGGTFGGAGTVAGRVSVGTGSGAGAFLAPGKNGMKPGTLTIQRKLILEADSTYKVTLDSRIPAADKVTALASSLRGGLILFNDVGASVIPIGTVFAVVENTAADATVGTFSNLPDGGSVTVGSNTFKANYEGGDGNDLTLTVIQ